MAGTIIITGSNGSLAVHAVKHLLTNYPQYTALLTVRDASDADVHTMKLRSTIAEHPDAQASILELDLTSLSSVHAFASKVAIEVTDGKLAPLAGIVCNAYYWNLAGKAELTGDGFDKSLQVTHLSHVALVLRLLGSFGPEGGRVVLFSSDAHWPGKNGLETYPPEVPGDLEQLAKPVADPTADNFGRGFQRYAVAKLAVTMWAHALNRYLEKDLSLNKITVVAINPGNLSDSRALRTNTPQMLVWMSRLIIRPLRPLIRFTDPTMRTAGEAAVDVVDLVTNNAHANERGYFTLLEKDDSSPDSRNEGVQQKLWVKSAEWAKITGKDTALEAGL